MRSFITVLTTGLALVAVPARADVVVKADTGFVARVVTEVAVSPAEAWKAMTTPSGWWQSQHTFSGEAANLTLDPVAGGCFCEKMPPPKGAPATQRIGSVQHMRVIYAEPNRALRLSGALGPLQSEAVAATMTMTLKPTDNGTRILWEYVVGGFMRYKVEDIAPAVDRMLGAQLGSLAKLLGPVQAADVNAAKPEAVSVPKPVAGEDAAGEAAKAAFDEALKKKSSPIAP